MLDQKALGHKGHGLFCDRTAAHQARPGGLVRRDGKYGGYARKGPRLYRSFSVGTELLHAARDVGEFGRRRFEPCR